MKFDGLNACEEMFTFTKISYRNYFYMARFFGKHTLQINLKEPIHRASKLSEGAYFWRTIYQNEQLQNTVTSTQ